PIHWDAIALLEHFAEVKLRKVVTLVCSLRIPRYSLVAVLGHPHSKPIGPSQPDLRISVPEIGCLAVPAERLNKVLWERKAANLGYADAQVWLGWAYRFG